MAGVEFSPLQPGPRGKDDHSRLPIILIAAGFGLFRLLYAGLLNLSPQEAYYWVWSLHPALSYFDHPPMAAYSIWASTALLGDTVFAVRLPAILYGTGTTLVVYSLAARLFGSRAGWVCALLMNLTIGFTAPFFFTTPDSPLIFFWSLTLLWVWKAAGEGRKAFWYLAGIAWGLALLSKYTAAFLGVSTLLWLLLARDLRKEFKRPGLYSAVLLAAIVFTPVILWNTQNHWASFLFQSKERFSHPVFISLENISTFFASQAGLMNPLLFLGFLAAFYKGIRRWRKGAGQEEKFLLASPLVPLVFFALASTRVYIKVNWPTMAYPAVLILLVEYYRRGVWPARWIRRVYVPALWVLAAVFCILVHLLIPWKAIPVSSSLDTVTGWPEAAAHVRGLQKELSSQGSTFILAWDHKTAAELQFYLGRNEPVYCRNLIGLHALAYDFWEVPRELEGKNTLLVWTNVDAITTEGEEKARRAFSSLSRLNAFDVYRGRQKIRTFYFSHGVDYHPPKTL
ncbi:MAG TPA: glycosyltransferase family 39 protein [Thermodesulfobacteriota bacterium]|nr:glycosyltransferase family 39 protein [Thermodesulfobacteriota bacterium]